METATAPPPIEATAPAQQGVETQSLAPPVPELADIASPPPVELQKDVVEQAEAEDITSNPKRRGKLARGLIKVAKGESLGLALDVASIAAGVPLPLREAAASTLDYQMYGKSEAEEGAEEVRNPSRMRKLTRATGKIAMYAVTGIAAQKYGVEAAQAMSNALDHGVVGEYIAPLTAKLGAIGGVNVVANRMRR